MYGGPDAAAAMGAPSRRASRPGAGLRVQGLERRRRRRVDARSPSSGSALGARRFATIDPEDFYDFQATRPRVKLVEGQTREIVWPAVELFEARVPRAPRDLILLAGTEPSFRWRTFCKLIVELAEALGTQLVVTLGRAAGRRPAHAAGVGHRPDARTRR